MDFKVIEEGKFNEIPKDELKEINGGYCLCNANFDLGWKNVEIGVCVCDQSYLGDGEDPLTGCPKHHR